MTTGIQNATRLAQIFVGLMEGTSMAVFDKKHMIRLALMTMFAGKRLLLEDAPGTDKTALARAISKVIDSKIA